MPWHIEHKQESRERILDAAARCFTQRGFDGVRIDDIMAAAGLTRGAFYAHFSSKSDLYACAMRHAAQLGAQHLAALPDTERRIAAYLSLAPHTSEISCPLACLVSDVAHRDGQVRDTYTDLLEGFICRFLCEENRSPASRQRALMQAVAMIGSLAIARSVNDPVFAEELMEAGLSLASCVPGTGEQQAQARTRSVSS
uniref:TetR/AcrR family transcriptional regulator n=1 Tax=Halomonas sp. TaxID=1486246 RepID=UPI002619EAD1|nr:TetR family transcriptional regulator [Halomonas sp.]